MAARNRMAIPEIAKRLEIGRLAVYAMLEHGIIPGVRIGRTWIVTHPHINNKGSEPGGQIAVCVHSVNHEEPVP